MWSGPRTVSTALMRSWENRPEGDYSLTQLYSAQEMFVTGTMGGIAPVISLDGRTIGTGEPGPVTQTLTALLAKLTATTGTPVT